MRFHGIDPGLHGAWAVLDGKGGLVTVLDLPLLEDGKRVDTHALSVRAASLGTTDRIYVERFLARYATEAHIRSAVNYGRLLSAIEFHALDYEEVGAADWKRRMGIMRKKGERKSTKARKARSMALAEELFGTCFEHDGQAEAALVAEDGRRRWNASRDTRRAC